MNPICPYCDAPYTETMLEAYDGTYGCESGCPYVSIVIRCESCNRAVYVKGDFGETDYFDWRAEVTDDGIKKAIKRRTEYP